MKKGMMSLALKETQMTKHDSKNSVLPLHQKAVLPISKCATKYGNIKELSFIIITKSSQIEHKKNYEYT